MDSVGRNHWSGLCCIVFVCLSDEFSAWAGWTQCGCSLNTEPANKTINIIYFSKAQMFFIFYFDIQCNLYFDLGQVDEAREGGEVVVV